MKLIRLSTYDLNCQFDSYFNEDIKIKAESQIALKSLSIGTQINSITINASNDTIIYNIRASQPGTVDKIVRIPHNLYTVNNFPLLLKYITQGMNKTLTDQGKEKGFQWKVEVDGDGKIAFRGLQANWNNHLAEFVANISHDKVIGGTTGPVLATTAAGVYSVKNNKPINTELKCMTYTTFPLCKGGGVFQAQMYKSVDNAGTNASDTNGFIFGLTDVNPSTYINTRDITVADFKYAIEVKRSFTADTTTTLTQPFFYWVDGVPAASATNVEMFTAGNVNNPYLNFTVNNGNIEFNVYQNTTSTKTTLHSVPYDNETELFGFFILRGTVQGGVGTHRLSKVIFTSDPFDDTPLLVDNDIDNDIDLGLSAPAPPIGTGIRNPSNAFLQFGNESLASFMGYSNLRSPLINFINGRTFTFTGDGAFILTERADFFLVELQNLQLNSYDDFDENLSRKGGRKSLLAVIPESDGNKTILYEPNNLDFIDIDNSTDLNIRNLRLRVLKNDYSPITCKGLSSLALLIKEKGE